MGNERFFVLFLPSNRSSLLYTCMYCVQQQFERREWKHFNLQNDRDFERLETERMKTLGKKRFGNIIFCIFYFGLD